MTAVNDTFGRLIDNGWTVYIICEGCNNTNAMDLEAMAARYGRDHGSLHNDLIKMPWKCDKCGSRKVSFRYQPRGKQYDTPFR